MFGLVPVWWIAGVFYFGWPLLGALLLMFMLTRGQIVMPAGSGVWLAFLALVVVSATQLAGFSSLLTFGLRLVFYLTAFVVCCYVFTVARERESPSLVLAPLAAFFVALVVLGWLGVLMPRFSMTTPMELILPGGLTGNPFIRDMVHAEATEYSARSLNPIFRPAAPYAYTNTFGSTYAILVPAVVACLLLGASGVLRTVLLVALPLSLPPAFLTLNRGMFLSLGVGLAVLGMRAVVRGNIKVLASMLGVLAVGGLAALVIPIGALIERRVSASNTNTDRMSLYLEVLRWVRSSPLVGFGTPLQVDTVSADAPIGTQGQLWTVLFSHGIPALVCFIGWFLVVLATCWRATSAAGQWLSVVPLIALVQLPFYGLVNQNLTAAFYVVGVALALTTRRQPSRPVRPDPGRPDPGRPDPAGAVPVGHGVASRGGLR
ncbi:O-antigen ligase domain-containing protein [Solwaraspora sp. WMMD406]|uniref:O-antigen ligase family protein n=1 Tax=Solwaraspora sp. WMMD406 TaxID=3016095 RepID=UPI0024171278|nr:O-antigen ligase domain-containing protein [Solwaraspora sp. WMMD406]MDG4767505.1 O-antigen ligase domain-containing protein [Solwaraspora sp. WMMD406]